MINLNLIYNESGQMILDTAKEALKIFGSNIIGAEFGVAWGGGIESVGKMWRDKGIVYGFDTFEGQPKFLAPKDLPVELAEYENPATCLDYWYNKLGTEGLSLEYQQKELDKQGLNNVKLIKGLIDESTNLDYIPYLNYALLDFDFVVSIKIAFDLIEPKLVKNSFLCIHDIDKLPGIREFYDSIMSSNKYTLVKEGGTLAVLQKI